MIDSPQASRFHDLLCARTVRLTIENHPVSKSGRPVLDKSLWRTLGCIPAGGESKF